LDASPLSVREEFEQEIVVLYQAEYMVGGTGRVAIESD
jgi:hypothetical protein